MPRAVPGPTHPSRRAGDVPPHTESMAMITTPITPPNSPIVAIPAAPFQIEFRPILSVTGEPEILEPCLEAATGRAHIESWAHTILDQHRSGVVHLVEKATGRSIALRPVWSADETPLPEWVSWHRFALKSAR